MFSLKSLLLLAFITIISAGLYESNSSVVQLNASNFKEKVTDSESLWFIEFYAPWCGHCQRLAPEWEKLASSLKSVVNIGAVDMTTDASVGTPFGISSYPTLKFFGINRNKPIDYTGGRSASELLTFALDQIKNAANEKLTGEKSEEEVPFKPEYNDDDVIVLTDDNFLSEVYQSDEPWFIEFYAQWCGHCKKLEPEWNNLAKKVKGQVKIAKFDAFANKKMSERFGISGYPTIKFFPSGKKNDGLVEDYSGFRDAAAMANFVLEKKEMSLNLELLQLVNPEIFKKYCKDAKGACVIAFLPHIYDSNKEERNNYLAIFEDVMLFQKNKPLTFLWSQAGDHFSLEDQLGLGSGFPAVATISFRKNVYSVMKGAFSKETILAFTSSIVAGKENFRPFHELPTINKVEKWDGEDKILEIKEEVVEEVIDREL